MTSQIARHLTYAKVTATLALFIALGGTAFAAARPTAQQRRQGAAPHGSGRHERGARRLAATARHQLESPQGAASRRADAPSRVRGPTAGAEPARAGPDVTHSGRADDQRQEGRQGAGGRSVGRHDDRHRDGHVRCRTRAIAGGVQVADPVNVYVVDVYPEANGLAWSAHAGNDDEADQGQKSSNRSVSPPSGLRPPMQITSSPSGPASNERVTAGATRSTSHA